MPVFGGLCACGEACVSTCNFTSNTSLCVTGTSLTSLSFVNSLTKIDRFSVFLLTCIVLTSSRSRVEDGKCHIRKDGLTVRIRNRA